MFNKVKKSNLNQPQTLKKYTQQLKQPQYYTVGNPTQTDQQEQEKVEQEQFQEQFAQKIWKLDINDLKFKQKLKKRSGKYAKYIDGAFDLLQEHSLYKAGINGFNNMINQVISQSTNTHTYNPPQIIMSPIYPEHYSPDDIDKINEQLAAISFQINTIKLEMENKKIPITFQNIKRQLDQNIFVKMVDDQQYPQCKYVDDEYFKTYDYTKWFAKGHDYDEMADKLTVEIKNYINNQVVWDQVGQVVQKFVKYISCNHTGNSFFSAVHDEICDINSSLQQQVPDLLVFYCGIYYVQINMSNRSSSVLGGFTRTTHICLRMKRQYVYVQSNDDTLQKGFTQQEINHQATQFKSQLFDFDEDDFEEDEKDEKDQKQDYDDVDDQKQDVLVKFNNNKKNGLFNNKRIGQIGQKLINNGVLKLINHIGQQNYQNLLNDLQNIQCEVFDRNSYGQIIYDSTSRINFNNLKRIFMQTKNINDDKKYLVNKNDAVVNDVIDDLQYKRMMKNIDEKQLNEIFDNYLTQNQIQNQTQNYQYQQYQQQQQYEQEQDQGEQDQQLNDDEILQIMQNRDKQTEQQHIDDLFNKIQNESILQLYQTDDGLQNKYQKDQQYRLFIQQLTKRVDDCQQKLSYNQNNFEIFDIKKIIKLQL